jgi:hypothetical protein
MQEKKKTDLYINIALLFVLGVLAGVALKGEAKKNITIGFEDYKMKFSSEGYKINVLQNKLSEQEARQKESLEKENGAQTEETPIEETEISNKE